MAFVRLGGTPRRLSSSLSFTRSLPLVLALILVLSEVPHGVLTSAAPSYRARLLGNDPGLPTRQTAPSDKQALLEMATTLTVLATWQASSDPCSDRWTGVTCDGDGNVVELNLTALNLLGSIPPQLGNLTHLRYLSLAANSLGGRIPRQLGQLQQLEALNLSSNHLNGGLESLPTLVSLAVLDLSRNTFAGTIPPELGSLPNLRSLFLSNNAFTGPIPNQLRSLKGLERLLLDSNPLAGDVPIWLPELSALQEFALGPSISITGSISPELSALTNLQSLRISGTIVGGSIPPELGSLASLQTLDLSRNRLVGPIPPELSALSNLTLLDLSLNRLSGFIPPLMGKLANLKVLVLNNNSLSGPIPATFGSLERLRVLRLQFNSLNGSIPEELGNLTVAQQTLMWLNLEHNRLVGPVPAKLGNLADLRSLVLGWNQLSGDVPMEFFNPSTFTRLKKFDVTGNRLTGEVRLEMIDPVVPAVWLLADNYFRYIGNSAMAINVTRERNCIGVEPPTCGGRGQRSVIDCARVSLEAQKCLCKPPSVIRDLDQLDGNLECAFPIQITLQFYRQVDVQLSVFLQYVDSATRQLAEKLNLLPSQVAIVNATKTKMLTFTLVVNLLPALGTTFSVDERKYLKAMFNAPELPSVSIPTFTPQYNLLYPPFDFTPDLPTPAPAPAMLPPSPTSPSSQPSTTDAAGTPPMPRLVAPSPASTGEPSEKKVGKAGLSGGAIVGLIIAALVVVLIVASVLVHYARQHQLFSAYMMPGGHDFEAMLQPMIKRFTYMELLEATDYFNENNRLGESPNGNVFRGMVRNQKRIAVKRLDITMDQEDRAFLNEVRVIGSIRHRNCLELHGYCLDGENRCLVFEFMPNGTLQSALFNRNYPNPLSWAQYAKILKDVAMGLRYLHHDCDYKVIHRDLSPDNILLDHDFTAVVADFGTPKDFTPMSGRMDFGPASSSGYMAPEFLQTGKLSEKCDVYSFGVVMLVVISGHPPYNTRDPSQEGLVRRAFDAARSGQSLRLLNTRFVNHCSPSEARRFINVALLCVLPDPAERPAMLEVVEMITGRLPIPPIIIPSEVSAYDGGISANQLTLGNSLARSISQSSTPSFRIL